MSEISDHQQFGALIVSTLDGDRPASVDLVSGGELFNRFNVPFDDFSARTVGTQVFDEITDTNFCLRYAEEVEEPEVLGETANGLLAKAGEGFNGLLLFGVPRARRAVSFCGNSQGVKKYQPL